MGTARFLAPTRVDALAVCALLHAYHVAATVPPEPLSARGRTVTIHDADQFAVDLVAKACRWATALAEPPHPPGCAGSLN